MGQVTGPQHCPHCGIPFPLFDLLRSHVLRAHHRILHATFHKSAR